jgi:cytoskeletal protein RodZ
MQENKDKNSLADAHHVALGPILGIFLIVLVIILGGLYLWGASLDQQTQGDQTRVIENNEPETPRAQADAQILGTVSSSDSLEAIETDVESTNLDSLDAELLEIDNVLNATAQ